MNTELRNRPFRIDYGVAIEEAISEIEFVLSPYQEIVTRYQPRWLAIKLLEGEADIIGRVRQLEGGEEALEVAECQGGKLAEILPGGLEIALADRRYSFISGVVERALHKPGQPTSSPSDRLDTIVTHPWLGAPLFLIVMYLVFNLVVNVSAPYLDWIDSIVAGPITS